MHNRHWVDMVLAYEEVTEEEQHARDKAERKLIKKGKRGGRKKRHTKHKKDNYDEETMSPLNDEDRKARRRKTKNKDETKDNDNAEDLQTLL